MAARRFAEAEELLFVEDGREVEIAEGAGTIGIELSRYTLICGANIDRRTQQRWLGKG